MFCRIKKRLHVKCFSIVVCGHHNILIIHCNTSHVRVRVLTVEKWGKNCNFHCQKNWHKYSWIFILSGHKVINRRGAV